MSCRTKAGSPEYILLFCSLVALICCMVSACGTLWLFGEGFFAYEGGYFLALGVYVYVFLLPIAVYYFVWPKPRVNRKIYLYCLFPYLMMIPFAIFFAVYY